MTAPSLLKDKHLADGSDSNNVDDHTSISGTDSSTTSTSDGSGFDLTDPTQLPPDLTAEQFAYYF